MGFGFDKTGSCVLPLSGFFCAAVTGDVTDIESRAVPVSRRPA
jgi:hypothetical protein